ncbi:hypothetical protein [Pseudomonas atacamensis]|uniref:hypothetical protein n=1 Tax=Pseudomonas atacamensis TaxID=2565368 RepID=UPI003CBF8AE0
MTIDKQKLQKLLWAEAASYRADCADWKRNTEALQEFLGEKTVEEVALELLAENERLKTLRSTTERDLVQELEVWKHGPSCWNCGDTGDVHDMVGEWRGQCDCNAAKLIDVSSERDRLRAENETLRKDAELLQSATDFVQKLCDSAGKQPSVATGYLHDILSALGKGEQS